MTIPTITVSLDKKCAECGGNKTGVAENGLCLTCTTKVIRGKPMRSAEGRAVAERWNELKHKPR